ncbi:hypothetical protein PVAG01_00457 [Phlyctema vagabunda]|uniref:Uncharacterized protein n=1 Tax=Phlyctema vagabunda TaxID=108571 RepID=A0ABR4PUB5_9HELO
MPFSLSRCLLKSHPSRIVGLVAAHHPTSPTPRTRARLCFYCPSPSNPTRKYSTAMAETSDAEAVKIMAEPASKECEILAGNKAREEALKEKEEDKEEEKLPKLSAADFRVYNSMAEHMEYFHNHFRQSWTMLYNSCVNNKRPQGLSLKQFISTGLQLCSHLGTHRTYLSQKSRGNTD